MPRLDRLAIVMLNVYAFEVVEGDVFESGDVVADVQVTFVNRKMTKCVITCTNGTTLISTDPSFTVWIKWNPNIDVVPV